MMAFPETVLPLKVELLLDGTWTEITSYVMRRDNLVRIIRGRSDEASRTERSTLGLSLNNRDGRFSPRNPTSPYYGSLTRSTQIRVSIDGGTAAVTEDFEDGTLDITVTDGGDAAWARSSAQAHGGSWSFKSGSITHSQTSDAIVTVPSGAQVIEFWWKVSSEEAFDFFSVLVDSTQMIRISGEHGWTKAVLPVAGATSVTFRYAKDASASSGDDAAYIDDLEFSYDYRRFSGEISTLPQRWDTTGTDIWVPIEAAGIMRRLEQGTTPIESSIRRGIILDAPGVVAYWPCEDGSGSTRLASGLSDGTPMKIIGTPTLANNSDFAASAAIPTLKNAEFVGRVDSHDATGDVAVRLLLSVPSGGATSGETIVAVYTTGTARRWELYYAGGGGDLGLKAFDGDGTNLFDSGAIGFNIDGIPLMVGVDMQENGTDVDWRFLSLEPGETSALEWSGTLTGHTVRSAASVVVNPSGGLDDVAAGHVLVQNEVMPDGTLSRDLEAWVGERAGERLERLCREDGIPLTVIGQMEDTAHIGAQRQAALLTLAREAAEVDGGLLYEPRENVGLGYIARRELYNQDAAVTLDYPSNELAGELLPTDDDRFTQNDITVSRTSGSSARAVLASGPLSVADPPDGVGRYDTTVTINTQADEMLPDHARWRLHLGTVDEARYLQIQVDLARSQIAGDSAQTEAVRALDVGDRLTITDPPTWTGPDDVNQLAVGFTEVLGNFEHKLTINNMPERPYRVARYGVDRYDTAGSELAGGLLLTGSSGDFASTPDAAALDITGDIVLTADATLDDWTNGGSNGTFVAKWNGAGNLSYLFGPHSSGGLRFLWTTDGSTVLSETSNALDVKSGRQAVQVHLDVDNGSSQHVITFKTAATAAGPFTTHQQITNSGTTSIHSGGADLEVGSNDGGTAGLINGVIHSVTVTDGDPSTGTDVADPAFADQTSGTTSFSDDAGNTWTVHGSAEILAASVTAAATELLVVTTLGPRWTTDSEHMPFDVLVGGEQMRVTAIERTTREQKFTVVRSVNGVSKSHAAGDQVVLYTTPVRAL